MYFRPSQIHFLFRYRLANSGPNVKTVTIEHISQNGKKSTRQTPDRLGYERYQTRRGLLLRSTDGTLQLFLVLNNRHHMLSLVQTEHVQHTVQNSQ